MATLSLGGEMWAEAQMWGSVMQRWGEMTQLPLDEHLRPLMQTRYVFHCNFHGDPEIDIISSLHYTDKNLQGRNLKWLFQVIQLADRCP